MHGRDTDKRGNRISAGRYPPRAATIEKSTGPRAAGVPRAKMLSPPSRSSYIIRLPLSPYAAIRPRTHATHTRRVYNNNNIIIYCTVHGLLLVRYRRRARARDCPAAGPSRSYIYTAQHPPPHTFAIYTVCVQNACPIVRDSHTYARV